MIAVHIICLLLANKVLGDDALVKEKDATDIPLDKGVMVLGDESFKSVIASNTLVLVDFYAPWCKHCQKLDLEFATAAWMISESKFEGEKAKFAKVDATVNPELAKEYNISRYPTVLLFKHGIGKPFTGGGNADSIFQWVRNKSGDPARVIQNKEEFNELVTKPDVTVLGIFKDLLSPEALAFLEVADDNMILTFGITSSTELFDLFRVSAESCVIIIKKFDEGMSKLEGEINIKTVEDFIEQYSKPLVVEFNTETATKIFKGFKTATHLIFFMSTALEKFGEDLEIIKSVAKDFRGNIKFISVDAEVEDNLRILEFLGEAKKNIPSLVLTVHEDDLVKYKPKNNDFSETNIRSFIKDYRLGDLKPHLNEQELPEDWNAHPVKILVASNFHEFVSDTTKNVFVEFYAPWCGHCKRLAPVWEEAGDLFKDDENIEISKMDMTANQMESIQVKGFPTFKLYKAGNNEEVEYTGPRTLEGLVEFLSPLRKTKQKEKYEL